MLNVDKNIGKIQWVANILLALSVFGGYLSYDSFGALGVYLEEQREITPSKLGLLYSAFTLPCLFCGLINGYIMNRWEKYGATIVNVYAFICSVIGLILCSIGIAEENDLNRGFIILIISRMLVGFACDSTFLVNRIMIGKWFKNSQSASLATSFNLSFPYIGCILAFVILPPLATKFSITFTFNIVLIIGVTCVGVWFFYEIWRHLFYNKVQDVIKERAETSEILVTEGQTKYSDEEFDPDETNKNEVISDTIKNKEEEEENGEEVKPKESILKQIIKLPKIFWLLVIQVLLMNGIVWPFVALSPDFFHEKYHYSAERSGQIASVVTITALISAPILGYIADKSKKPFHIGVLVFITEALSFALFALTDINPILGCVFLGIGLSGLAPVFYTNISAFLDEKASLGFGILRTAETFVFTIVPFIFGYMAEYFESFRPGLILFCLSAALGSILSFLTIIILYFQNRKNKNSDKNKTSNIVIS